MVFTDSTFSEIDLSNLDTSQVKNMSNMFKNCVNLTNINLSVLNTSNAVNMQSFLEQCTQLTSVNLKNLDTSNVTLMNSMFLDCTNLTTIIGIENLNLSKLTHSNTNLFSGCYSLTNETLNNILKALSTVTYAVSRRTLARQGITQEQATICTTLPNWSLCTAQGWTTGF